MPAFVTHELLGTQVFSMLDEPIAEMLELNPSPYFWGLQGPDLLFFRDAVFGRSMLPKYGNIMHTQKTDELFAAMSCYLNLHKGRKQYETLAAYILGFAGHYCLDREAHPYVYFKQIQKERVLDDDLKRGVHMRIESDIDTAFYEMKTGKNIRKYRPASRLFGSEWEYEVIARLYVTILWEVYGIRVKESERSCTISISLYSKLISRYLSIYLGFLFHDNVLISLTCSHVLHLCTLKSLLNSSLFRALYISQHFLHSSSSSCDKIYNALFISDNIFSV